MSMVNHKRSIESNALSPDSDLVQAARAIRDEVLDIADKKLNERLGAMGWDKDNELIEAAKAIRDEVLDIVDSKFDYKLKVLQDHIVGSLTKSVELDQNKRAKSLESNVSEVVHKSLSQDFDNKFKMLEFVIKNLEGKLVNADDKYSNIENILGQSMSAMVKIFETSQSNLVDAIKSMPVPHVHLSVPVDAIQVQQLPSIVNLPQGAIQINQSTPIVNLPRESITINQQPSIVNVPVNAIRIEQSTPIVNMPEGTIKIQQSTPIVNLPRNAITITQKPSIVNVPKGAINVSLEKSKGKTMVEKTIVYDAATGRPAKIMEETTEE